jgi:hypothetical protein
VLRKGTEAVEGVEVFGRSVALMAGEAVAGVLLVELLHPAVAVGFGEDGGRGDGVRKGVAVDEGLLGEGKVDGGGVYEQVVGGAGKGFNGPTHGKPGSLEDVDGIDFGGGGGGHRPGEGALFDQELEALPFGGIEFF